MEPGTEIVLEAIQWLTLITLCWIVASMVGRKK
jgi:hypothetical protein